MGRSLPSFLPMPGIPPYVDVHDLIGDAGIPHGKGVHLPVGGFVSQICGEEVHFVELALKK
jgi:hypothetical protein